MTINKSCDLFSRFLFWGWNIFAVFLFIFLIGFAVLPFVFIAAINGQIAISIFLSVMILMLVPMYALYFGAKNPDKVVAFFFGVEIPIVILTLFRLFIVRELTIGSAFLLLSGAIGVGVFGWSLIKAPSREKGFSPYLSAVTHTVVLLVGVFVALLSALYALPLLVSFFKGLFSLNWVSELRYFDVLTFTVLGLFLTGSMAFFIFPLFMSYFYPKSWFRRGRDLAPTFSPAKYGLVSLAAGALWLLLFSAASQQNHAGYVSNLANMSVQEKAAEMQTPQKIRKRLLDAYLYEYRFLGVRGKDQNLINMYKRRLGNESLGHRAQALQSYLLGPLLYKGELQDKVKAGNLYSELFDSSIQRDEKKAITKALEATYNRDEVTAGLMNIGARNVIIREQNIEVTELESTAVVEIEEVYENLTFERQEIFYYFTLPEDAAITGIWIGQTDKRDEMDAYIVAPRGAAQKVYEDQVRRNIDPALLEQVGPRQYRLRVFPIPVTKFRTQFSSRRNVGGESGADAFMRVHMRYVVPSVHQGQILPQLLEKRNVDWTRKTKRRLNKTVVKTKTGWMPDFTLSKNKTAKPLTVQVGEQFISMTPHLDMARKTALGNIAVIVDTSYSMRSHMNDISETLADLNALANEPETSFDFYISRAGAMSMTKSASFTVDELSPFGSLTLQQMLAEFVQMPKPSEYDAILVLTDQGLYGESHTPLKTALQTPLYILHVDKLAPAYDDDVLDLIYRSGGGVAQSLADIQQQIASNSESSRISGNRVWSLTPTPNILPAAGSFEEKALAARQLILMQSYGTPPSNEALDRLHALATRYDVISPYSSMIVLVNERQKEALKKASEADDRFDRESRSGEENLSTPSSPLVSGVPEPHEWLLIIIAFAGLLWLWRRRDAFEMNGRFMA